MKVSHIVVLLVALGAGLVIGAMKPGFVQMVSGGLVSPGS
jgi:hypothetical protein